MTLMPEIDQSHRQMPGIVYLESEGVDPWHIEVVDHREGNHENCEWKPRKMELRKLI